jgi:hypothetical protein
VSPAIESGHVFVPEGESWAEEFLDQWTAFPAAAHDDMVDSSTQALSHMLYASGDPLHKARQMSEDEERAEREQEAFLDGDRCYDVYGQMSYF